MLEKDRDGCPRALNVSNQKREAHSRLAAGSA